LKVHGRKIRSGLRSTKQPIKEEEEEEEEAQERPITTKTKQKIVFTRTYNLQKELDQNMYTDQTGRFLVRSYLGN
jgi:hypothetical protein